MKKILFSFFAISLLFSSCSNERDVVSNETENLAHRGANSIEEDPLCLPPTPPQPVNFGNPSDYPTLSTSTYYSLTNPNNGQVWFFDAVKSAYRDRYGIKSLLLTNFHVGSHDFPVNPAKPLRYDVESIHRIYASDGMFYQLYPNSTLSQSAGSYVLYKILSSIDEVVINNKPTSDLGPVAITFNYDVTMCGQYSNLYFHVYYKDRTNTRD